ncbi:MAG: hypothetical protein L6R48_22875 [Planctomycetes bacterium]|nr:hypothetical protein [Planctomycetota bacterium]
MALRLAILDPGHFHAALPLRSRNPRLDDEVRVYAPEGPELARFLAMVGRFNTRAEAPTAWRLQVHRGGDPLAALLADGADVAVLAGRNRGKLARIRALTAAGIHVLADKPWVVEPEDVAHLDAMAGSQAHWADLMTERHEPWAALFATLARTPAVVGDADPGRGPVLDKATIHHLAKQVDGVPLVRPAWYFDVREQGEGLIDVTTHLVDQVLLIAGARERPLAPGAVRLQRARRWATAVGEADFRTITASAGFPPALASQAAGGVLPLMANGELEFTCGRLSARVAAEWRLRAEDGAGDRHRSQFHGTRADLVLEGGAAGSQLTVVPRGDPAAVAAALDGWIAATGAAVRADAGGRMQLRPLQHSGHEEHFAQVLEGFLGGLARPQPAWERAATAARYRLLAEALTSARVSSI